MPRQDKASANLAIEELDKVHRKSLPPAAFFLIFLLVGLGLAMAVLALAPEWLGAGAGNTGSSGGGETHLTRGRLEFEEPSHDFGDILDGAHKVRDFAFGNVGTEAVTVLEIIKPCSCVSIDGIGRYDSSGAKQPIPKDRDANLMTLEPGERGYVTVRVFPAGRTAKRKRDKTQVLLRTNAALREQVRLEIQATFIYPVAIEYRRAGDPDTRLMIGTGRQVNLGGIGRTQGTSFWIDIVEIDHQIFGVTGEITIDGKPVSEAPPYLMLRAEDASRTLPTGLPMPVKRLTLDLGGAKPLGAFRHMIRVPTSIHDGEYVVEISVMGWVGEDLHLEDVTGRWDQPRIAFGSLQQGEPTSLQKLVKYVGSHPYFKVLGVRVQKDDEEVPFPIEAKVITDAGGELLLNVILPEGAQNSFVADVVLETNLPEDDPQKTAIFAVKGVVMNATRTARTPPPSPLPHLQLESASAELGDVVHGQRPRAVYKLRNPGLQPLYIYSIAHHAGLPMSFVEAKVTTADGLPAKIETTPDAGSREALVTIPPGCSCKLQLEVDTRPLKRGKDEFKAIVKLSSNNPISPVMYLNATGSVSFPAGIFAASADHPDLILPVHSVWLPPVGRTGELEHTVHLRATRAPREPFVTSIDPAPGTSLPAFLSFDYEQIEESPGYILCVLKIHLTGTKPLGPFECKLIAKTSLEAQYELHIPLHGEVLPDLVLAIDDVVSQAVGPAGELQIRTLPRKITKRVYGPLHAGTRFHHVERLMYLGKGAPLELKKTPRLIVDSPKGAEECKAALAAIQLSVLPPDPGEGPYHRLDIDLPRGLGQSVSGRIVLEAASALIDPVEIPFELQVAEK